MYTWNLFCPLFWGFNPQKEGLFFSNQNSCHLGSRYTFADADCTVNDQMVTKTFKK